MAAKNKKELILCDYCKTENDASHIYSAKKHYAGCKIPDILEAVTRRTIPSTIRIKLCRMCASTLLAASGVIAKAEKVVDKLLPVAVDKNQTTEAEPETGATEEHVDGNTEAPSSAQPAGKNKSISNETPNAAKAKLQQNGTPIPVQLLGKGKQPKTSTPMAPPSTPSKQQSLDTSLQNAVKLTPATDEPKKTKAFIQLFGSNANKTTDEDEDEDEEDEDSDVVQISVAKNIAKKFECKNCDFTSLHPLAMKNHCKEKHGQKRPRVFNCFVCPKSFGRMGTLKVHLKTHGVVEDGAEKSNPVPELATLTALKTNPLSNGDDISFNVPSTLSSTQKFIVKEVLKLECETCHAEFSQFKALHDHMTIVHNIEDPKVYKCAQCILCYKAKWSLDRHIRKVHGNGEEPAKIGKVRRLTTEQKPKAPSKVSKRRKTVAVDLVAEKEPEVHVDKTPLINPTKEDALDLINEIDFNDILEKTFEEEDPIEKHIKPEAPATSKRNDEENNQLAKITTLTPKKQKAAMLEKRLTGELLTSWIKPMPKEHDKVKDEPNTPNKKKKSKSDKDILDSIHFAAPLTNGTPNKLSKRKSDAMSQEDTADTTAFESNIQDTLNSDLETIDLMDEVNSNVKPHKRAKLDSINESEISCNLCTKVVPTRKRLDSHMQKRHATELTCPNCHTTFNNKQKYVTHFDTCADGDLLPCGVYKCKKIFQSAHYLSSHLNKKHNLN